MVGGRVTVIFGENSFERASEIAKLKAQAEKAGFVLEKLTAENLTEEDLVNAVCGMSLLADKRLVLVRNLSENTVVWARIAKIIARISSDVHLCLVEEKIDKRSVIYKELAKLAEMKEQKALSAKDTKSLAEMARRMAKQAGLALDHKTADFLVSWVGVDEWRVRNAVGRLAILGEISEAKIREFVPQTPENNAFEIFEAALRGNFTSVIEQIARMRILEGTDGAYQFFGLISSQFFNLVALRMGKKSGKTTADIAKQIGTNAWALGKFEVHERGLSDTEIAQLANRFAETDTQLKSSGAEAWDLIEALLLEIAKSAEA